MEPFEREYDDSMSDFDDRLDINEDYYTVENDDSESLKEEDGFYRHLDEY
ncbi:hypothetical protein [Ekhidna sp.]